MTPRPGDNNEDEDWEDDVFADFKAAGGENNANDDSGEIGSFTQISMPVDGEQSQEHAVDAAVTKAAADAAPTEMSASPLARGGAPPVVETVGDTSEFSQSETASEAVLGGIVTEATSSVAGSSFDEPLPHATTPEPESAEPAVPAEPALAEPMPAEPGDIAAEVSVEDEEKKEVPDLVKEDTFGDFGGSSDQTSSVQNDPVSADMPMPLDNSVPNEKSPKGTDSMGLGDFATTETEATLPSEYVETVDHSDSFGDFGTAPVEPDVAAAAAETVENNDSFGDFGAAPIEERDNTTTLAVETVDHNESFGDFGGADVATAAAPTIPEADVPHETAVESNGFGDLGTAEPESETISMFQPENEASMEADFGDFGAAQSAAAKPETEDTAAIPSSTDEIFDSSDTDPDKGVVTSGNDGWDNNAGDFGVAEMAPATAIDDDFGDFGTAEAPSKRVNDSDGFGDFGAAEPGLETKDDDDFGGLNAKEPAQVTLPKEDDFGGFDDAKPALASTDDKDDTDFGDFDSAEPAQTTKNDDFGDFGAAESAKVDNGEGNDGDDDFGDFDAARPAQAVNDDDDFGDFDAAEPMKMENDGGDDDFGDFDAAEPTKTTNDDDDDFGDFDAADDTPKPSPAPPVRSSSSMSASDPLLQNVAAAMHRTFQLPAGQAEEMSDDEVVGAKPEKQTIEELMKSMTNDASRADEADQLPSFWDMMKQMNLLRKGEAQTIKTGIPPYRLHYPLHGFTSLHETKKPPETRRASVPAVLDVKLRSVSTDSAPGTPSDAKSNCLSQAPESSSSAPPPAPAHSSSPAPTSSNGTVVKLPPKTPSEDPSRVDVFFRKIPDLSFMLSPKLSLPAQS